MSISWSLAAWLPVLRRLPDGQNSIALTIDDAPNPDSTPLMLDLLDMFGAKATFFLSGCRAHDHGPLIARMVERGHWIYAHGWDHVRLDKAPPGQMPRDMDRCEALLAQYRPTPSPYLVRLPQNGGYRSARIHKALAQWMPGCQFAHWGASTEDHLIPPNCTTASDITPRCQEQVDRLLADPRLPGSILLMHDQPINERPGAQFKSQVSVTLLHLLLKGLAQAGISTAPITPLATQSWWSRFILV